MPGLTLAWHRRFISRRLQWHREKAGIVEHVHDEVKNGLGGRHLPSAHFNVNAAWFKVAFLAYPCGGANRRLALGLEESPARLKKFRAAGGAVGRADAPFSTRTPKLDGLRVRAPSHARPALNCRAAPRTLAATLFHTQSIALCRDR